MTPMCPPGGTYSIAGTLTSATDLASSRSVAVCGPERHEVSCQETQSPETCDKAPETQRPETYLTPVTTNQVRGTITLGGTISACGPASLPVCGPLFTRAARPLLWRRPDPPARPPPMTWGDQAERLDLKPKRDDLLRRYQRLNFQPSRKKFNPRKSGRTRRRGRQSDAQRQPQLEKATTLISQQP